MKVIKQEIKELAGPAIIVVIVGILILGISCYIVSTNTVICYPIEIWIEGCPIMDFFLPLLVTIPFSISLYMKRINGFVDYAAIRIGEKKYVRYQMISGIIICAIMTFFIYFVTLLLSLFVFFEESSTDSKYIYDYVFGRYEAERPILFGVIWCVWKGIVASLFTYFGYQLALYMDNIFMVSILPFIYVMAENLITGILQIPEYGIMTSYVLNRLTPEVMSVWNYIVGVISFMVISTIIVWGIRLARGMQYGQDCSY